MASWKRVSSVENLEVGWYYYSITVLLQHITVIFEYIYIAYTKGKVH